MNGGLGGDLLTQHDYSVAQVADGAHCAAGGAVQALLRAKLMLQLQHGEKLK